MPIHLCRLLPPRPTFPADMTAAEAGAMQEHAAYWRDQVGRGSALVVGPVMDPRGAWGVAIVQADDAAGAAAITDDDPIIRLGGGFRYEILPMPQVILPPSFTSTPSL